MNLSNLPRLPLVLSPTPLVPAPRLSQAIGLEVWFKRDDLTGRGLGGNKVRTLEYLLGDAQASGCDVLVTGAGPQSNWAMLAALSARAAELEPHLVFYGDPTPASGNLLLTQATANGHLVAVVLDTGSQVTIGNSALRKALMGNRMLSGTQQQVVLESVTGEKIVGEYMFLKELEIGGITLRNLAIVFTDAHTFKQLRLDRQPALLLGMNAMRAFRKVSIDFGSRKLRVLLPEQSQRETWRIEAASRD